MFLVCAFTRSESDYLPLKASQKKWTASRVATIYGGGKLFAYENTCRHIPISLDYGDNRFFTTKAMR